MFKKYEYTECIIKNGGFSAAAEALGIAQPTLSKYVKKLENDIGAELFDRSKNPIELTAAGEVFLETGRQHIYIERQFQKRLSEIKENKNSVVRIGISPSRSIYMMPAIIEAYQKINPEVKIIIEEKTTSELTEKLSHGELDLVINLLDGENEPFEHIELFDEDVLLVAAKTISDSQNSAKAVLKNLSLITIGHGQAMWQTMNKLICEVGSSAPKIEAQSIESAYSMVKRGLGAMIIPSYIYDFEDDNEKSKLNFYKLSPKEFDSISNTSRKVCIFFKKEQYLSEAERSLISCIRNIKEKNI